MTEEEFKAVLAVDGLRVRVIFRPGAPDIFIARIVQPILSTDTSEGPFRMEGMERTVLEVVSDESINTALNLLISAYSEGDINTAPNLLISAYSEGGHKL